MKSWSQRDPRWGNLTIGATKWQLNDYGCYIVSLSILDGRPPNEILSLLNANKCFDPTGRLYSEKAATALGMAYTVIFKGRPKVACIAETDYYKKKGVPQHFFVLLPNGRIIDPLDGLEKENFYPIVSYRLFSKVETKKEEGGVKMLDKVVGLIDGYKTKTAAILTVVVVGAKLFGVISPDIYEAAVGFLAALGLWGLKSAIEKAK